MTVRGTRTDAERELAQMVAAARAVRAVGVRSSVSELLEAWFAIAAAGWSPTTMRQTRSVLDRDLHAHLGDIAVGEVTPAMIDDTYAQLRRGGGMKGQPLAAGTLARVHVVLRAAFAQAMRWGWIWDNPAERAHRIVSIGAELRPPTPTELRTLLDHVAVRDRQLHALLVLAAFTGARRAQLLGLRWHNVHLAARRLSFSAGWVEGPNGPVLTATKTKRRHVVDLDPATFGVLVDLAAGRGCDTQADAFVFSDDQGATAWKPNRVTKAFSGRALNDGVARCERDLLSRRRSVLRDLKESLSAGTSQVGGGSSPTGKERRHRRNPSSPAAWGWRSVRFDCSRR